MSGDETLERCTNIEIKLAYLEDFIKGLQTVTLEHEKKLETLCAENKALRRKIDELAENTQEALPHVKPPHY